MQNRTHNLILLTAASVLAIVVVVVAVLLMFYNPTPTSVLVEEDILTPDKEGQLQEQIAPLIKAGDIAACDQVQNKMYRSVCINNIALKKAEETNDISYCQHLDGELISKETCERQVIMATAIISEDISACAQTTNESLRQECEDSFFFGLAQTKNDPTVCDQMEDKDQANQCWNIYHMSPSQLPQGGLTTEAFDCQVLRGEAEQVDCQNIIPIITTNPTGLAAACQNQRSQLFEAVCMRFSSPDLQEAPNL